VYTSEAHVHTHACVALAHQHAPGRRRGRRTRANTRHATPLACARVCVGGCTRSACSPNSNWAAAAGSGAPPTNDLSFKEAAPRQHTAPHAHAHTHAQRLLTKLELGRFSGFGRQPSYLAIGGKVFDVSKGGRFYGE
jgi:hypothetical protein